MLPTIFYHDGRLDQPLLFLLARFCRNELIRQMQWLKAENEMLRKRVGRQRILFGSVGYSVIVAAAMLNV